MLAAAALGALGAQLEQLQAAKQDWFVGASLVDEQDISLEADGAVTVRRQAFDTCCGRLSCWQWAPP